MNRIRRIGLTAAAILTAVTLGACGIGTAGDSGSSVPDDCEPAHPDIETVKEGFLTVASFDLLPYTKVEGTDLQGLEGDVLKEVAKLECLELVAINSSATAAIPAVQSGRADITAADWYRTAARAEVVALSAPVFADQMAFISESGVSSIEQVQAEGLTVGTVDGYLWVEELRDLLGDDLKLYSSTPNVYGDLKAGRVDVVVDGFGPGAYNGEGFEVEKVEPNDAVAASVNPGQSNFPMRQGNTALIEAVNDDIEALREDGTLADLLEKYDLDPSAAEPGEPSEL